MKSSRFPTFARNAALGLALAVAVVSPAGACIPQIEECGGTSTDLSVVPPFEVIRQNAGATALEGAGLGAGVLAANGTNCSSGEYARGVDASGNAEGCTADSDADTTCNDAGVSCLFAGSATEGGPATTALALAADGGNCSVGQYARGVDAAGAAQSCTADADTTCNDAGVSCLFAGSASEGGPATTALALNANGANCSVGEYARGVDAAGAAEGCTAVGAGDTTCLDAGVVCAFAGSATEGGPATTALALAANGGNCAAGTYPLGVDAAGAVESCGSAISGNAATATALAANGANCTAGNYPLGVDASGAAETCTALPAAGHGDGANCSAGQYPLGVDAAGAVQSCTADDDTPDSDSEVPNALTISGGTIDGSPIGATTPSTGVFSGASIDSGGLRGTFSPETMGGFSFATMRGWAVATEGPAVACGGATGDCRVVSSTDDLWVYFSTLGMEIKAGSATSELATVGGTLAHVVTDYGNTAATTEQDAASYTLPGNSLSADGDWIRVTATFKWAANGNSKTHSIYFGGAVVYTDTGSTSGAVVTVSLLISRTSATTVSISGMAVSETAARTVAIDTTSAKTLSSNQIIKATVQTGTAAASNVILRDFLVEIGGA